VGRFFVDPAFWANTPRAGKNLNDLRVSLLCMLFSDVDAASSKSRANRCVSGELDRNAFLRTSPQAASKDEKRQRLL
jgi:hypothetical protein